jgi:hypothetical protein
MYVASRSLLRLCDHKISNPTSESQRVPDTFPTQPGQSVYCHPTALKNFVHSYLPKIHYPFVLVSGDSDMTVPSDCLTESTIVLDHPLLLCWYSQNCTSPSDKLKQLPIGLDFHTLSERNHIWGPKQTLQQQESMLLSIRSSARERLPICYSNFHFLMTTRYGYDRKLAVATIPQNLIFYEPRKIAREQSWKNMIKYKYVVSPHGNGLDCHRTWEALALGCIPIVKTSPLDPMFEGLPVLIVNDWKDITKELLDSYNPTGTPEKLTLSYWKYTLLQSRNVGSA